MSHVPGGGTPAPSPPPPQPAPRPRPNNVQESDYLTVLQAAAMLGCHKNSVYARIYSGELPWYDFRRSGSSRARIRVAKADVHGYMAPRKHPGRAA